MTLEDLQKKRELFSLIYDITNKTVFSGDENDADIYVGLMEERQELFNQIKILDEGKSEGMPSKEAERILTDIKVTINKIVSLDKAIETKSERIMNELKKSLKDVNQGMSASKSYIDHISTSDGMYFDQKN
jgi:hypothetical protein